MGWGKPFRKLTHAIEKPFKELGKGWWVETRVPLLSAAAAATGAYYLAPLFASAGTAAAASTAATSTAAAGSAGATGAAAGAAAGASTLVYSGLAGAGIGTIAAMSHEQAKAQKEQLRLQQETEQRELEAAFAASLKPDTAPSWETQTLQDRQSANSRARKRAFSLSRTVNRPLSLGALSGRQTLG